MCGENKITVTFDSLDEGSPPRVRGKLCISADHIEVARITPACAGKTDNHFIVHVHDEDHPRVCGENRRRATGLQPRRGSPPRVRGKPHQWIIEVVVFGITPACAGKTLWMYAPAHNA